MNCPACDQEVLIVNDAQCMCQNSACARCNKLFPTRAIEKLLEARARAVDPNVTNPE